MTVFVDTSAMYAALDATDARSAAAARCFRALIEAGRPIVTHEHVVVEASALVQRRLPAAALRDLHRGLMRRIDVVTVSREDRERATAALLAAPRGPSLVDRISFEVMRRDGLTEAFAFDRHFADEGFATVPV